MHRFICQLFKAMYLMKWSRLFKLFLDFCYIVWCDVHDDQSLGMLQDALNHFHKHCEIFRMTGVCPNGFNLLWSHSAVHYMHLIWAFGAPNGLCSSIMEPKHIVAVKEPWQCSSRWNALKQMLTTNSCLDKLVATQVDFTSCGMLEGTVLEDILHQLGEFIWYHRILNISNFGPTRYYSV